MWNSPDVIHFILTVVGKAASTLKELVISIPRGISYWEYSVSSMRELPETLLEVSKSVKLEGIKITWDFSTLQEANAVYGASSRATSFSCRFTTETQILVTEGADISCTCGSEDDYGFHRRCRI